ncbi:HNH endonuclease [Mycoplasmopsis felis]|uniref:HNH endonuclease n=1 Tax=Mycoplasmopsis felis TaxID=33923 RepID=UPI002AFF9812|nr:HNH endonuclease domain-containing protein [Mycoplasmopsis felis]WQQ04646.1 HNH endonuclease domain-containing protein [Mycoplasmopsis felis]
MKINKHTALNLWDERYGNKKEIQDYTGKWILRDHYEGNYEGSEIESDYVWNLDHLIPISRGGGNNKDNLVICHVKTNEEKDDKTSWNAYDADGDEITLQINKKRIINFHSREVLYDPKRYK